MKNQLVSILVCGDCIISRENSISIIKIVEKVLIKDKGTYPFWIYICLRNITGEHKLQVIYKNNQSKQVEVHNGVVSSQSPKQLVHFLRQITIEGGEYGDHELFAYLDNELIGETSFQAISSVS